MSDVVCATTGDAMTDIQIFTPAAKRLGELSTNLRKRVREIQTYPLVNESKVAANFFGSIRALAGIIEVLAEQPGYRPTDVEGQAVKARMLPLKEKMDEITRKLDSTVNLMSPLEYTAPKMMSDRAEEARRLAGILLDPAYAADIKEVSEDKSIPDCWKAQLFQQLGRSIHNAMLEVVKTKYESQIFDAVKKALDEHKTDLMIGGCLWASQSLASAGGNLPGANSLYVGAIRLRAMWGLKELGARGSAAVLDDILPHWFEALKFTSEQKAGFEASLKKFKDLHKQAAAETTQEGAQAASGKAQQVYENELLVKVKSDGQPQSGVALSGAVSFINLICLILVWESMPDKYNPATWSVRNWVDLTGAGANFGFGFCATLARMRVNLGVATRLAENARVGLGLGIILAAINVGEGIITAIDGYSKGDYWLISSGTLQLGSGVMIVIGIAMTSPGAQLAGVVLGLAATAVSLVADAAQDKMLQFLSVIMTTIKSAVSAYDGKTHLVDSLGLGSLISELEGLISSCKVTELAYNRNWVGPGGEPTSKIKAHDSLIRLGIADWEQRGKLVREVWAS